MIPVPPANSKGFMDEENGSQSLLTAMNKFVGAVNRMDNMIMVPSRLMDMKPEPSTKQVPPHEENNDTVKETSNGATDTRCELQNQELDLRSCYRMLNAIKGELIRGTPGDDSDQEFDETSRKAALTFRTHLNGLFKTLHQLSDCADFLTDTYEKDLRAEEKNMPDSWGKTLRL